MLEFEWDSQKAAANLAKHKISFEEAATVFADPLGRIVADPRHSSQEERFVLLGRSRPAVCSQSCMRNGTERFESSAHDGQPAVNGGIMKKRLNKREPANNADADEILPEYDFSRAARNKYASRYAAGSAVVVLEPDVAAAFPSPKEANEALRALAGIIQKHRSRRPSSHRRS